MRRSLLPIAAAIALALPGSAAAADSWFVRAGTDAGGDGSRPSPFASLADAEAASGPGDRVVVLRSAETLDGGIGLAAGQRLIGAGPPVRSKLGAKRAPRLTNTAAERLEGDAVRLADGATVRNLVIEGASRGGIYGLNVDRVRIRGNVISGHNASCTPGFHIPPFQVPTTAPGAGIPISEGLHNGWAAIMVDADSGKGRVAIAGNRVGGAECGDGIDLRMSGSGDYRATVRRNAVADLRQGPDLESVLAFGMQTRDDSSLKARLDRNTQTNLGNEEDLAGPEGADSEGVFVNPVDTSAMTVRVTRNTYTNPNGLGGFSGNGLEYVTMGDGSDSRVVVEDSSFDRATGDGIEQLALGTNSTMRLRLVDVRATDTLGFAGSGIGNTVVIPGNNADCVIAASGGAGNVIETDITGGEFTGCANNGITFGSAVANGSGSTRLLDLEVSGAKFTGNQGANLRVGNETALDRLSVKVENSDLGGATGVGSGLANVTFEELGTTTETAIDLGGGPLGSTGGNCLGGAARSALVLGYAVSAERNWWGQPGGPAPGSALVTTGSLDAGDALGSAPAACPAPSSARDGRLRRRRPTGARSFADGGEADE